MAAWVLGLSRERIHQRGLADPCQPMNEDDERTWIAQQLAEDCQFIVASDHAYHLLIHELADGTTHSLSLRRLSIAPRGDGQGLDDRSPGRAPWAVTSVARPAEDRRASPGSSFRPPPLAQAICVYSPSTGFPLSQPAVTAPVITAVEPV